MKMKKGLLTMLALLSIGSSAFAQKTLNVPEVARRTGPVMQVVVLETEKKGSVKILLSGTEDYRDLQFDIKLPTGVTAAQGKNVFSEDFAVQSAVQSDGQTVRFVLYSVNKAKLSNEILFEIPVTVNDLTILADAKAKIENVLSSNDEALTSLTDIQGSEIPFSVMKLGDVTDNGEVDLSDAQALVAFCFSHVPSVFVKEVADLTGNAAIDISDAQALVAKLFAGSSSTSAKQFVEEEVENELDPE